MKLNNPELSLAHHVAYALLSYPDDTLLRRLDLLRLAAVILPGPVGAPLTRMVQHLADTPLPRLSADYVKTFDLQWRCSPYLTQYTCGDARRRGSALLRIRHAYRAGGMELIDEELADHLAVVLEFSAAGHPQEAGRLLCEHRAGLEGLWRSLRDIGSPYADVLAAVRATLPDPGPRELAAMLRLGGGGPSNEWPAGRNMAGPPFGL